MSQTIAIDEEAHARIQQARREGESVSEVIKRCIPRRRSLEEVLKAMHAGPALTALEAADRSLARRRSRPRRSGG
jgi:predicted CopG family antitoxin